jgi:hypothetical protein
MAKPALAKILISDLQPNLNLLPSSKTFSLPLESTRDKSQLHIAFRSLRDNKSTRTNLATRIISPMAVLALRSGRQPITANDVDSKPPF